MWFNRKKNNPNTMEKIDNRTIREIIDNRTILNLDILENLFRIKVAVTNSESPVFGTGFTLFRGEEVYLITTAHLFNGIEKNIIPKSIYIQHNKNWDNLDVIKYFVNEDNNIDISIFEVNPISLRPDCTNNNSISISDFIITSKRAKIGQQIIFAGYPTLNDEIDYQDDLEDFYKGFPRPFLKFGYVSHYSLKPPRLYIDGVPNLGISGGPVMFRDTENILHYLGVVTGAIYEEMLGSSVINCLPMGMIETYIDEYDYLFRQHN